MIIHPNVLLERMSATRMPVPRSLETKKKVSKEPEEAKIPFMPHPNLNVTRDKDLMEQLYPNCFTLHHPNIKISRMPKYKHCAKKAIEKTKESKKVCCKVRKAQTPSNRQTKTQN